MNTLFRTDRIHRTVNDLLGLIYENSADVALTWLPGYYASPADAARDLPAAEPFPADRVWGGRNGYAWFHGEAILPATAEAAATAGLAR